MAVWACLVAGLIAAAAFVWAYPITAIHPDQEESVSVRNCCADYPPTLRDVLRHLPPADAERARDGDDLITWAHEGLHFCNSRLSKPGWRGFYLLDNTSWRFPVPKNTRLSHVAAAIPEELRGPVYKTYLVDARRDWEEIALYPLDECLAYWTGAMVRQEIKRRDRQETERYAIELTVYSKYAVHQICEREDDEYPRDALQEFLDLIVTRGRIICPDFDQQPYAKALSTMGRNLEVADAEAK
jgi:hypothetical protein